MYFESIINTIGRTPVVRLGKRLNSKGRLLGKLELANPFGMKDRFALEAIMMARENGELKEGGVIIESSSGTLAAGLALVGCSLGHPVHIVTDPRIDQITLSKLKALGAHVHIVPQMNEQGWQGARLQKLYELLEENPGAFWPRQYTNEYNPLAYRALAKELIEDVGQIDILVGSVGSGGSLCGTARALKETLPELKVIGVDAVGSAIFGQPDNPRRLQSGLGNSLIPKNVNKEIIDQVHWLSDGEAFNATLNLAKEEQIFAGNSSGSSYWVARWLAQQFDGTVLAILPDRGDRYCGTVYSAKYWEEHNLLTDTFREEPQKVKYGELVSTWSYADLR